MLRHTPKVDAATYVEELNPDWLRVRVVVDRAKCIERFDLLSVSQGEVNIHGVRFLAVDGVRCKSFFRELLRQTAGAGAAFLPPEVRSEGMGIPKCGLFLLAREVRWNLGAVVNSDHVGIGCGVERASVGRISV